VLDVDGDPDDRDAEGLDDSDREGDLAVEGG
jgi:hypothetical protein